MLTEDVFGGLGGGGGGGVKGYMRVKSRGQQEGKTLGTGKARKTRIQDTRGLLHWQPIAEASTRLNGILSHYYSVRMLSS